MVELADATADADVADEEAIATGAVAPDELGDDASLAFEDEEEEEGSVAAAAAVDCPTGDT